MVDIALILQFGGGMGASVPTLIAHASPFSKAILLGLVVLSVWSWAVIWERLRLYDAIEREDRRFLLSWRTQEPGRDLRLLAGQHPKSHLARVALAGQRSLDLRRADGVPEGTRWELALRAMERAAAEEHGRLEKHVGFLATTGSVSPFVGLLGTVWGVMAAFLNIGTQGSASLVVVAPGIAEALIATVAGLAAAIPAVVGYNHCLGRLRDFTNSSAQFVGEFLDRRPGGPAA
jgi:biopolymer transport protein TolQ